MSKAVLVRLFSALKERGPEKGGELEALVADFEYALRPDSAREALAMLDLAASWTPERRASIGLMDALPAAAWAILPDVLRGLSVKGMAAQVEAQVGAVSPAAKVAAWAGGLSSDDVDLLLRGLMLASTKLRELQPRLADRLVEMWAELTDTLNNEEPRPAGCQCHLEAGDSPCPVHAIPEDA